MSSKVVATSIGTGAAGTPSISDLKFTHFHVSVGGVPPKASCSQRRLLSFSSPGELLRIRSATNARMEQEVMRIDLSSSFHSARMRPVSTKWSRTKSKWEMKVRAEDLAI